MVAPLLSSCFPRHSCESRNPLSVFAIIIFFFEFSVFAFIPADLSDIISISRIECERLRNLHGATCNTLEPRGDQCWCNGAILTPPSGVSCPIDDSTDPARNAQLKKKPTPLVDESKYSIRCGNASAMNLDELPTPPPLVHWVNWENPLYPYKSDGTVEKSKPLRMCWTYMGGGPYAHVSKSKIKNITRACSAKLGHPTIVFFNVVATCPYNTNNDKKCKDILRNMLSGKVTFKPNTPIEKSLGRSLSTGNYCQSKAGRGPPPTFPCPADNYGLKKRSYRNPEYAGYKRLWDTVSETYTNDYVILYAQGSKGDLFTLTHPMPDMQCYSDNIKMKQVCECPTTPPLAHYTFEPGEDGSCYCSDGTTLKEDKEGSNCPTPITCPATEGAGKDPNSLGPDFSGNCRCQCSNPNNRQASFLVPSNTASCPVVASNNTFTPPSPAVLSDGSTVTGNECRPTRYCHDGVNYPSGYPAHITHPDGKCDSCCHQGSRETFTSPTVCSLNGGHPDGVCAPLCDIPMPSSHTASDNTLHNSHHPSSNPSSHPHKHPYVSLASTSRTTTPTKCPADSDKTLAEMDSNDNKWYCYRDRINTSTPNTETKACASGGTRPGTNYGKCTATATGGANSKCLTFSYGEGSAATGVTASDPVGGSCTPPSVGPINVSTVHGICDRSSFVAFSCLNQQGTISRNVLDASNHAQCVCVDSSTAVKQYTCERGNPSSQTDSCECRGPAQSNTKTCDPDPNGEWLIEENTSLGTCDCPTGWTRDNNQTPLDDGDDTCTKTASGSTVNRRLLSRTLDCQCSSGTMPAGSCTPEEPGDPLTVVSAIANGWECSTGGGMFSVGFQNDDLFLVGASCADLPVPPPPGNPKSVTCLKYENSQTKLCTEGGNYEGPPVDKCVKPCTQSQTVNSCICKKESTLQESFCPAGWVETTRNNNQKCRVEVPAPSRKTRCKCDCLKREGADGLNFPFDVGDATYNLIKNESLECVDYKPNDNSDCNCKGIGHLCLCS